MEDVKILIIEDEHRLSDGIKNYLESQHYLCEQAFNFADAKLKASIYEYDCVLCPEGALTACSIINK